MSPLRLILALLLSVLPNAARAQEFRAMWADAFHAGLRNGSETSAVIAAARSAKCNAVVVQVRKRGDAYYRNGLEPPATQINDANPNFDPLADLIAKGHNTSGGNQRIDVHAWIVSYNIWNDELNSPTQPTHPYNLHPDWLSQRMDGTTWDGGNYLFDPAHPAVQQHTFAVCMDIVNRYNVDGIHFDYIRYPDAGSIGGNQPWGYNPVSVARYQKLSGTSTVPAATNAAWLQWRRDQVTALVRKVYLNTWAVKPTVRVSASLICYDPSPTTDANWLTSAAYHRVLQDWRGWLEEGILDLGCQMVYKTGNTSVTNWTSFIRDRQYGRASAIGLGWYLNPVANTITQIGIARGMGGSGNKAAGILGYSYAVPNNDGTSQSSTWASLTAAGAPFASTDTIPAMPWKTNPAKGNLMGTALAAAGGIAFDGATIALSGPVSRTFLSDATGFFGGVDLPVGTYSITLNLPGYRPIVRTLTVTGGAVTQVPLTVVENPFLITNTVRNAVAGTFQITWNSVPGRTYRVEKSDTLTGWTTVISGIAAAPSGSNSYQWTIPGDQGSRAFLRVVRE